MASNYFQVPSTQNIALRDTCQAPGPAWLVGHRTRSLDTYCCLVALPGKRNAGFSRSELLGARPSSCSPASLTLPFFSLAAGCSPARRPAVATNLGLSHDEIRALLQETPVWPAFAFGIAALLELVNRQEYSKRRPNGPDLLQVTYLGLVNEFVTDDAEFQKVACRVTELLRTGCGYEVTVRPAHDFFPRLIFRGGGGRRAAASDTERARGFPAVLQEIRKLEELRRAAALYRSHPELAAPDELMSVLRGLFADRP